MHSYQRGQQAAAAALCEGYHGIPRAVDFDEERPMGPVDWEEWYRGYCDWMTVETGLPPRSL